MHSLPAADDGPRLLFSLVFEKKKSTHTNTEEAKMTFAYCISALKAYCLNNELSSDLAAQK